MITDFHKPETEFLSNFYMHEIEYQGIKYPSSEHAYQASKTLDFSFRRFIAGLSTPGKAKRAGNGKLSRQVYGERDPSQDYEESIRVRPDWNKKTKLIEMRNILEIKFSDGTLRAKLVATHPVRLVEGNTWKDTFWGVCNGEGENHLGKILMKIRSDIINGQYIFDQ